MNTIHRRREADLSAVDRGSMGQRLTRVALVVSIAARAVVTFGLILGVGCSESHIPSRNSMSSNSTDRWPATAAENLTAARVNEERVVQYPNEEYNASIVQILVHRDRYHGKKVQIEGYLRVQFEGTAIYLSKEDADYGMTRNGFCVTFGKAAEPYEGDAEGLRQFDRKYVLIEGTFDKEAMGHMSLWQGGIMNVSRIVELDFHP